MNKKLLAGFWVLGLSLGMTGCTQVKKVESVVEETREYDFYNSLIFQNGDSKEVYLNAIINTKDYDLESMFEKIKEEYFSLNGYADKLTLKLYENVGNLKSGNCVSEKVYID